MKRTTLARLPAVAAAALLLAIPALPQANDISGKWHFVTSTADTDYPSSAVFKVAGGQVTGKWDTGDVKGAFANGEFELAFPYTYAQANIEGTMHLKGKLADGKLAGTWDFAGYSGAFKATRED